MRKSIFMYLFFFALLWVVFQYVNSKNYYEKQQATIKKLEQKVQELEVHAEKSSTAELEVQFSLEGNENAYTYFDKNDIDIRNIEQRIQDALISYNTKTGNDLIPFENASGIYRINSVKTLNHKWVIADFSDGKRWGELILSYDIDQDGKINFTTLESLVYPLEY